MRASSGTMDDKVPVLEVSSDEDDTESHTAEMVLPNQLIEQIENQSKQLPSTSGEDEERPKWKQAKAQQSSSTGLALTRRVSMGFKQSHESFVEEVRKNQRRDTISKGKSISVDIWQGDHGFREFFDSGKFSDVVLVMRGKEIPCHRIILAFASEYFASLLGKPLSQNMRIVLDFPDPENVMEDIIRYMYTGEVVITPDNAVPLLALADHYLVTDLKTELSTYISKNVQRENAVALLRKALQFHSDQIADRCVHVLASNFAYIYDISYDFLPFNLFSQLLYSAHLNVLRESDVLTRIRSYVASHPELTKDQRCHLMEAVRYRWLSTEELITLKDEGMVPQELLLEATFARLEKHEPSGKLVSETLPERLKPRPFYPMAILYRRVEKGICPGILDWIARDAGRREWQNPHVSGDVIVSASSLCKGNYQDLVSVNENELWSKDVPASWFCIDFGPNRTVIATSYTLRHGGNYRADSLRNWDFQGSVDGWQWETLMSHRQDQALHGPFAIAHWELAESQKAFRFFRVIQTGHNSSSRNFLVLSNIELYGKLFDKSRKL